MSHPVIRVEKLSKRYRLQHESGERYTALRDVLAAKARRLWFSPGAPARRVEDFWALREVSFEVAQGERIGIVGRNGAGKSTLLKVLSRITEPSGGKVSLKGRVASLLEVGTGFHPELTGRENVFLNGAILGMGRREIARKFDEIVAFAEVERFLDTPVKRYSSGMQVRLAFAVAAHLEPEILVVDEVLAVGDAQFQRKCLGKMEAVGREGRTVLFVSHQMSEVQRLCTRCILLDRGEIARDGAPATVVEEYLAKAYDGATGAQCRFAEKPELDFQVLEVRVCSAEGSPEQVFSCDAPVVVEIDCVSRRPVAGLYGYLALLTRSGMVLWVSDTHDLPPNRFDAVPRGRYRCRIALPPRLLGAGGYKLHLSFASSQARHGFQVDTPGECCSFELYDGLTRRGNARDGHLSSLLQWELERQSD